MSSSSGVLAGPEVVAPRFRWHPPRADTLGPDVVELMGLLGVPLDAEQELALDELLGVSKERTPEGIERWAQRRGLIVEPRQNGKTDGILLPIALYVAMSRPDQLVTWSAHRYKTAREAFLAILKVYRRSPLLRRRVLKVTYSNGEEAFEFKNGSRIVFVARSQASGRGLSGDLVILDEALFVTVEMLAALMPIMSARPNGLMLYASSACLAESTVLHDVVDELRAGDDQTLAGVEWCAPPGGCADPDCSHALGVEGCMLDDPANYFVSNPAMRSGRITVEAIAAERRALRSDPLAFARERLGWHADPVVVDNGIAPADWAAMCDPQAAPVGDLRLAVDASPDHKSAAIVVYGDGVVEVLEHRRGATWLAKRTAEIVAKHGITAPVAIDPDGPAGSLMTEFEREGVQLEPVSGKDAVRATAAFIAAIRERSFTHCGESALDDAVRGARRRKVGDGHKWTRADSLVDICPLAAATWAVWVAAAAEPNYDVLQSAY